MSERKTQCQNQSLSSVPATLPATSKEYFEAVGETKGWVAVPSGTRKSVEEDPRRLEAAPFADTIVQVILSVDPADPTRDPVPYTGVQFVAIPEFQGIGYGKPGDTGISRHAR
ncbi:MAG: hypothetical protein KJO67_15020 [Silicimonas sp.]|nr:hypothetical protein [Silicimonas sp.]